MMGTTVFDAGLDTVSSIHTQDWPGGYSTGLALSPDGQFAYLSTRYGYQKVRLSDLAVLEQVKLGMQPRYLFAWADGNRLIAVGYSSVLVIDLR